MAFPDDVSLNSRAAAWASLVGEGRVNVTQVCEGDPQMCSDPESITRLQEAHQLWSSMVAPRRRSPRAQRSVHGTRPPRPRVKLALSGPTPRSLDPKRESP